MKDIKLLRIGNVEEKLLIYIKEKLNKILGIPVNIAKENILPPNEAYNTYRRQYYSPVILSVLSRYAHEKDYFRVLGIANVDAYVEPLNFVFGEAIIYGRAAVVYLPRLRPEFYGDLPNERLFYLRVLKECLHELGHTFGLYHCSRPRCVMCFSNSIYDVDFKEARFCEVCERRVREYLKSQF